MNARWQSEASKRRDEHKVRKNQPGPCERRNGTSHLLSTYVKVRRSKKASAKNEDKRSKQKPTRRYRRTRRWARQWARQWIWQESSSSLHLGRSQAIRRPRLVRSSLVPCRECYDRPDGEGGRNLTYDLPPIFSSSKIGNRGINRFEELA